MARRVGEFLELSGPIFEATTPAALDKAIGRGIKAMGEDVKDIGVAATSVGGFVRTGAFISSWESKYVNTRGAGYAAVRPSDVWPKGDRPTRTWAEKGTRAGVKLRKGLGIFSKTRTRARQLSLATFEREIEKVLN